ncbi:hypothetical protein Slin15195_G018170 [Septoria linicola]|uniref:Glycoprotease family protein n=1 Tax=Septoria linicola TaxID=215465 RepID=A0A9Q9EGQ3_9PEZI|nr:hypothetical protein Slin14017_G018230 [Septoria linicola]USW48498.1 hypothetical protein Slin15195_G018170 [Septoria linicola]
MFSKSSKKKTRGKLSIDTTCAFQPKVFPYESQVPELKFVSFDESHARIATSEQKLDSKTPVYAGAKQAVSNGLQGHVASVRSQRGAIVASPGADDDQATLNLPYHKRLAAKRPEPLNLDRSHARNQDLDCTTPVIVITPARDEFRGTQTLQVKGRPASSVYSRYTNCMTTSSAPPVPPLPFMGKNSAGLKSRFSTVTATTTFEDVSPLDTAEKSRAAQTPGLPTPRRSKGWWNVLSPFSAKSTRPSFWRSPSPASDGTPVLKDAAAMGQAPTDSESLHSAAGDDSVTVVTENIPQRSLTAPAALHGSSKAFDIYHIASTGLAAAYFDVARRFPSLCVQDGGLGGWSPSQSVYLASPDGSRGTGLSNEKSPSEEAGNFRGEVVGSAQEVLSLDDTQPKKSTDRAVAPRAALFSTPSAEELQTPPVSRKTPVRAMTETTNMSVFSPLSATPEVHQAHLGMLIGPDSSFGEQRQIAVSRAPTPTVLDDNVASYTSAKHTPGQEPPSAYGVARLRPTHARQDSYGLGISDEKNELFPPPKYVVEERPRLGTDRFGQLTVRSPGDDKPVRPWYRRHFWLLAFLAAALVVLLIVLLTIFVPPKHNDVAIQATWLNLTGLPVIPIGISTVIQPQIAGSRDTCTKASMWNCQSTTSRLPDFRFEIRSRNGTSSRRTKRTVWQDYVYAASPPPPSESDRLYLGRTTDNITEPYSGEDTPIYISLLDTAALSSSTSVHKRSDTNFTYPYPTTSSNDEQDESSTKEAETTAASKLPNAAIKANGKPIDPLLYPLVKAQPLRLFNRGEETEHYGFYSYFDRSIYIASSDPSASLPWNTTTNHSNITTNVPLEDASAVCTFSQTRLLVQIWTRRGTLSNNLSNSTSDNVAAKGSSANDMSAPGSFPYPVTVTIDRHGGSAAKKGVYCYALDDAGKVDGSGKGWLLEDRAVGGELLDPAQVPGDEDDNLAKREKEQGEGIDGGSGGCQCQWKH